MKNIIIVTSIAIFASALFVSASSANVLSAIGDGLVYTSNISPADSNSIIYGINEQQGVTLLSNLVVGDPTPGLYTSFPSSTTILAGATVNSHLLLFNPLSGTPQAAGTFTFDGDILGVIVQSNNGPDFLSPSDFLQQESWAAIYNGTVQRGLELGVGGVYDSYSIVDSRTIGLNILYCGENWMDQMRVITAPGISPPGPGPGVIPEPASMLLMVLGLLGVFGLKHKFRK